MYIEKTVSGSTNLPLAQKNYIWNAVQAERRVRSWAKEGKEEIDWKKYQKAFFWYDEDKMENITSYKLGFADIIEGKLTAVPRAIIAIKAVLRGARGGVNIPMEDKVAVSKKVNVYLKKLDYEPLKPEDIKNVLLKNKSSKQLKQVEPVSITVNDRIIKFVITDETLDRDNDLLTFSGWNFENYNKNPIVLFMHDYKIPAIGTAKIYQDEENKRYIAEVKFPKLEELSSDGVNFSSHATLIDTIYNLYKNGYMNAVSVGFSVNDWETVNEDGERKQIITEKELLEFSLVSVPCNPNALVTGKDLQEGYKEEHEEDEEEKQELHKNFKEELKKLLFV